MINVLHSDALLANRFGQAFIQERDRIPRSHEGTREDVLNRIVTSPTSLRQHRAQRQGRIDLEVVGCHFSSSYKKTTKLCRLPVKAQRKLPDLFFLFSPPCF